MLKRKEKILIGAFELLEAGGISGLTTKKLAAQQGVSEPALYRQFTGKLDIIKGLIEEYASFDDSIMDTIIESNIKGKKAVDFYVGKFIERYKNYYELTTIMYSMDLYFYNEETKEMMKKIQNKRRHFLIQVIEESQEMGEIDTQFTAIELADMIDGLIFSQIYKWRMADMSIPFDEQLVTMINRLM